MVQRAKRKVMCKYPKGQMGRIWIIIGLSSAIKPRPNDDSRGRHLTDTDLEEEQNEDKSTLVWSC